MKNEATLSECGDIARRVLRFALSEVLRPTGDTAPASAGWGIDFGKRWIGALHDGFRHDYSDTERFAVFSRARPASGPASTWQRHEYLHDVAVAEAERRPAPIRPSAFVPVVTRCLWQVESEVGLRASGVAEDLGKLVCGSAASKLFIAAVPAAAKNLERWKAFIEQVAKHVPNNFFLALIPTYSTSASAHEAYMTQEAFIRFYTRINSKLIEDPAHIGCLPAGAEEPLPAKTGIHVREPSV